MFLVLVVLLLVWKGVICRGSSLLSSRLFGYALILDFEGDD